MTQDSPPSAPATWVLVANEMRAFVLVNAGPGTGLVLSRRRQWRAAPPSHVPLARARRWTPADLVFGAARADHGAAATGFADKVAACLGQDFERRLFSRLGIVSDLHTLHRLRAALDPALQAVLVAVVGKDLTAHSLDMIEAEVGRCVVL